MPDVKSSSEKVANWVNRAVQDRRSAYATRDLLIHGLRRQRFLRQRNKPARAYQRYVGKGMHSAVGYRLVQTVTGAIARELPRWRAISSDDELVGRVQRWIPLTLDAMARASGGGPFFWRFIDRVVGDGIAPIKVVRRPWADMPLKEEGEADADYNARMDAWLEQYPPVPFRARLVDGLTFYPPLEEWRADFTLETGVRPTQPTLRELRLIPAAKGQGLLYVPPTQSYPHWEPTAMPATLQVDEVWTPDVCFIRVAGKCYELENEYGEIPYKWCRGELGASDDPGLSSLSVLFPLQYIEPWLDQCLTILAAWTQFAQPTPATWYDVAPAAGLTPTATIAVTDFEVGRQHNLGPGGHMGFIEPPEIRTVVDFANLLLILADRAGMAPVPPWVGTRTAGTTLSTAQEAINAKLRPIISNIETCYSELAKMLIRWVADVIKAPVRVSGFVFESLEDQRTTKDTQTLRPADVPLIADVQCSVNFRGIQDEIAMGTHAAFMAREELWSRRRAMIKSGVEDPAQEDDQIAEERAMRSPAVQEYLARQAIAGQPELEQVLQQGTEEALGVATPEEEVVPQNVLGGRGATTRVRWLPGGGGGQGGAASVGQEGRPMPRGRKPGTPRRPGGRRA